MNNLYPSHQADALFGKLATDTNLREQMLRNPRETLSLFGFEIDSSELTQPRKIASEATLIESAQVTRRQKEIDQQGTLAIAVFVLNQSTGRTS